MANIIIANQGAILPTGHWEIGRADYSHLASLIERHPNEYQRIMDEMAPCHKLEHRNGICPLGDSHRLDVKEGSNTITNLLRASIINQFINAAAISFQAQYIATGTAAGAFTAASTSLGVETYRAIPSSVIAGNPVTTQALAYWFFGTASANPGGAGFLNEWAIYGGAATSSLGVGSMLAAFLQNFAKSNLSTASGQYTFNLT